MNRGRKLTYPVILNNSKAKREGVDSGSDKTKYDFYRHPRTEALRKRHGVEQSFEQE